MSNMAFIILTLIDIILIRDLDLMWCAVISVIHLLQSNIDFLE